VFKVAYWGGLVPAIIRAFAGYDSTIDLIGNILWAWVVGVFMIWLLGTAALRVWRSLRHRTTPP
jgi:hypothetical protein